MKNRHFLAALVFAALGWVGQGHSQSLLFAPAPGSPVAVGEGSGLLVIADVNGDGKPDLLAQHLLQRFVTIHFGDGAGRFSPAPGSPLRFDFMPGDLKPGDVNGDGLLDLCVTSSDRDAVNILLGDGRGGFKGAPGSPFLFSSSTEANSHGLQLADINADGKLDLITTNNLKNSIATMLGDGRGGFTRGPSAPFPAGEGRYSFVFGDLDGDGQLDAAIVNNGGGFLSLSARVVLLRGDGKGAFKHFAETPAPAGARYAALGDVNGDGRLDIVLTCGGNEGSNEIRLLLNQGGGKFTPAAPYALGAVAFALGVADVNQDKRNDLIVATVDSVTVLLNGNEKFTPAPGSPYRAGPGAYHLALGDVNGDGKPDIVANSFEGKAVTVLLRR